MRHGGGFGAFSLALAAVCGAGCTGDGHGSGGGVTWVSTTDSYGFCAGECVFTVLRDGADVKLQACSHDGMCTRKNVGRLTDEGRSQVAAGEVAVGNAALENRYGCPDCADGGATTVTLQRSGQATSHEYETGNPPDPLADLDAVVREIRSSLDACTASSLIQIEQDCQPAP